MSGTIARKGVVQSDPEWEASKAARRTLSHAEAVAEVDFLVQQYRRMYYPRAADMVDVDTVIRTLNAKKIPFVLTGAHGIASWTGRPRATHDVDVLVKGGRNYARAVKAMRERYPQLECRAFAGVAGFFLPGDTQSLLDVTYPHRADIEETLATAVWVEERGLRYRVPRLEAALANKYGAMLAIQRDAGKRTMDAVDFYWMGRHAMDPGREPLDLARLEELGEKVWPGGGGVEILSLVEQVKAGQVPKLPEPK